jgi:uncharacterized cupredoxin-like copper-binding protein
MKTKIICSSVVAAALALCAAQAAEEKTLGEKTSDTLEKAKEKTKEAGRAVASGTKQAVEAVKDAVTPDADARKVDVTLTENHIAMPKHLEPGKTAFVVRNTGKEKHNFEIEGQGIEKKFLTSLDPDESKTLHVDLKPGTYKVFCPMKDHEHKGMELSLLVK